MNIHPDEIFISDGAKSDCGNIGDIFSTDNTVAVCDPVYPVYVDTNAMAGREQLKAWVDYANANGSIILYDSPMRYLSATLPCPTPSLRSRAPAPVPSSSAPSPRQRALRAPAVPIP